jgi:hypothetical protein
MTTAICRRYLCLLMRDNFLFSFFCQQTSSTGEKQGFNFASAKHSSHPHVLEYSLCILLKMDVNRNVARVSGTIAVQRMHYPR